MEDNIGNGLEPERKRERVEVERRTKWLSQYKIPGELLVNF